MSRNIVFEGWLTKSPPAKRIWRAKWRRRWFSLRQSSELPGQYFLDYYADRNSRRLKGTIDLDLCEQVDAGLHMERGNGALDPKIRGSGFTIRTQSRTYYLEADCEADMGNWVDCICRVCGLRSTDEISDDKSTYQANLNSIAAMTERYNSANQAGPYIPISECITGSKLQEMQRAFTFGSKNIVTSRRMCDVGSARGNEMYMSQPHIRQNTEFSENDSNPSDEDCKSLNSQCHIGDWAVARSFKKLTVTTAPTTTNPIFSEEGPPVPPRPAKTLTKPREYYNKDAFQGPKIQEPMDSNAEAMEDASRWLRVPNRTSHRSTSPSSGRKQLCRHRHRDDEDENLQGILMEDGSRWLRVPERPCHSSTLPSPGQMPLSVHRYTDDEDENLPGCPSPTYSNMVMLPPAVDRALKPRHSSYSFGHINNLYNNNKNFIPDGKMLDVSSKPDVLQYLDLDLQVVKPPAAKAKDITGKPNGKSLSEMDDEPAYKIVDFKKTEAFKTTRLDVEASRSQQQ